MTRVYTGHQGDLFCLECLGHAGYAESGKDVVCAAVSAICQTLYLWCKNTEGVTVENETMKPGMFMLMAKGPCEDPWKAAVLGLMSLEAGYPNYVRVEPRQLDLCSKPQCGKTDKGADT